MISRFELARSRAQEIERRFAHLTQSEHVARVPAARARGERWARGRVFAEERAEELGEPRHDLGPHGPRARRGEGAKGSDTSKRVRP